MSSASTPQPKIRTSELPRELPSNAPMPKPIHDALATALLENRAIPRIEGVLSQSLAETGWSDKLRAYIQRLIRTGEAHTHDEIMVKVEAAIRGGSIPAEGETNGNGVDAAEKPDLKIPEKVVRDGVKVVRQELEKVVTIEDMDEQETSIQFESSGIHDSSLDASGETDLSIGGRKRDWFTDREKSEGKTESEQSHEVTQSEEGDLNFSEGELSVGGLASPPAKRQSRRQRNLSSDITDMWNLANLPS